MILEQERLAGVWVDPDIKFAMKEQAAKERRQLKEAAHDAFTQYLAVKNGSLIVTPATPREDTRE